MDLIVLRELSVRACIGDSAWPRPDAAHKPQPVIASISVPYDLTLAGASDQLAHSLNYGALAKLVEACFRGPDGDVAWFASIEEAAEDVCAACFARFPTLSNIKLRLEKPRAALRARSVAYEITRSRIPCEPRVADQFYVSDLELYPIIGCNEWERVDEQLVRINLRLEPQSSSTHSAFPYPLILREVATAVTASKFYTLEAFVSMVAQIALKWAAKAVVRAAKPSALMFAAASEVEITRTQLDFVQSLHTPGMHVVAVALGSNLADRFAKIESALCELETAGVTIIDTSFLYETPPMYVQDQPSFLNGACLARTTLAPGPFLALLKQVEAKVGRVPSFHNGPRVVDLDVLFWDDLTIDVKGDADATEQVLDLTIPHPRMQEREFVLKPLNDIMPEYVHPVLHQSVKKLLANVVAGHDTQARKVICFPCVGCQPPGLNAETGDVCWTWGKRTFIMATLNCTPDSFSDGGEHMSPSAAVEYAQEACRSGADIIDVGGCSTRPGAPFVSEADELARVIPVVTALRAAGVTVPISVDTFRAAVAEQAVRAGANCINDVTALTADARMASVAKALRVPVIMMHSRGAADANKEYTDVVCDVRRELGAAVTRAGAAGVRRWNIIADPGIGFSKTLQGNATLLRELGALTTADGVPPSRSAPMAGPLRSLPVLVGASRKSFLGKMLHRETSPKERDYATAAACTAAIQQGCDIVRVHNVAALADAIRVADAIFRH